MDPAPQQQVQGGSGSPACIDAFQGNPAMGDTLSSLNDNSQHEGGGNENNLDRRDVVAENVGDGQKGGDVVDDGSSATHEANADSSDGGLGMAPSASPSAASSSSSDWEEFDGETEGTIADEEGDGRSEAAIKEAKQRRLDYFDTCQGLTALRIKEFNENERALRKAERDSKIDEEERKARVARLEREEALRRKAERSARIEEAERRARAARRRMWMGRVMLVGRVSFAVACAVLFIICAMALQPWLGGDVRARNKPFRRSLPSPPGRLPPSLVATPSPPEIEPEESVPSAGDAWTQEPEDFFDGPWV